MMVVCPFLTAPVDVDARLNRARAMFFRPVSTTLSLPGSAAMPVEKWYETSNPSRSGKRAPLGLNSSGTSLTGLL